jgi:hypothetical protein
MAKDALETIRVNRFRNCVTLDMPSGFLCLTAATAKDLAKALFKIADSCETEAYGASDDLAAQFFPDGA